jgi:hypothetical protein
MGLLTLVSLEVNLYKLIMPPKNRMHLTPTKDLLVVGARGLL